MRTLKFRNISIEPDEPVAHWGVEGMLAAIDRGSLPHWRRIATAIRDQPWGPVAQELEQALVLAEDIGVATTLRRVLAAARREAEDSARAEVRRRLRALIESSGLTAGEFAHRLGTSPSRLSTYVSGKVVPSATLLIRGETVASTAREQRRSGPPVS